MSKWARGLGLDVGAIGASEKLRGLVALIRPLNCAMAAVAVLLAGYIATAETLADYLSSLAGWAAAAVAVFVVAAGNALNDVYDIEVDRIAHPERPLPSGMLRPSAAYAVAGGGFGAAFLLSLSLNLPAVAIAAGGILLMLAYERSFKRQGFSGNLAISALTGALFLFGGVAVGAVERTLVLALLAALSTLGREIVKDIEDLAGDRGRRATLPARIGPAPAGWAASLAFLAAVLLSPLPVLFSDLTWWLFLPAVSLADGMFLYAALVHFRRPTQGQQSAKAGMIVALVAFLVGRIG